MDINDVLSKAMDISTQIKFKVRKYDNKDLYQEETMTYFELGMFLNSNHIQIERVDIKLKEEGPE